MVQNIKMLKFHSATDIETEMENNALASSTK